MESKPHAVLPLVVVAVLAALPLTVGLGDRYLWQDEAHTALLAERLLRYGRPLGFDGSNLLTMDRGERPPAEIEGRIRSDPEAAIRYFVERGDFEADTTWTGHPWGQFLATGLSMAVLGKGTWQARLPFALMGIATAVLLFAVARRRFGDPWVPPVAVALLLTNVYWILHVRQCRYYAASSFLLLVTLAAWLRWQDGRPDARRLGAAGFVVAAWCWFQFDYGSLWPFVGLLLLEALRRAWPQPRETLLAGVGFAVAVAPFVGFYGLFGRLQPPVLPWAERALGTLALVDGYVLALPVLAALAVGAAFRRGERPEEARFVALLAILLVACVAWVTLATPYPFHRYVVGLAPLGCLLAAWAVVELARLAPGAPVRAGLVLALTALLALTPLASLPVSWIVPEAQQPAKPYRGLLRDELRVFAAELAGRLPDPNRDVIAYLEAHLEPGDEVLINYEDVPVMFYTGAPVRGGIAGFRVDDEDGPAPRFAILRSSANFAPTNALVRAMAAHRWVEVPVRAPDLPWSNSPDPAFRPSLLAEPGASILFLERAPAAGRP